MTRPTPARLAEAVGDLTLAALAAGQSVRLVARGGSMRPSLRDGDVLTVAPIGAGPPLRVGDVVLWRRTDGRFGAVHRLVRRRRGHWLVRGDALPRADGWFPPAAIVGRVVAARRAGRAVWGWRRWARLARWLGPPRGRLAAWRRSGGR